MAAVTQRLHSAIANRDVQGAMGCLQSYVYGGVRFSRYERTTAVDALIAAIEAFAMNANVVGACFCALAHVFNEDAPIPVMTVLDAAKTFERSHVTVIQAVLRLLHVHTRTPQIMEEIPRLAERTARWMQIHPLDRNVAYYGAHVLIKCAGQDPEDVTREHGVLGLRNLDVAIIQGSVSTRLSEVHIQDELWSAYVLRNLYPRMRERA